MLADDTSRRNLLEVNLLSGQSINDNICVLTEDSFCLKSDQNRSQVVSPKNRRKNKITIGNGMGLKKWHHKMKKTAINIFLPWMKPCDLFTVDGTPQSVITGTIQSSINGTFQPAIGAFQSAINGAFWPAIDWASWSATNGAFKSPINGTFNLSLIEAFQSPTNGSLPISHWWSILMCSQLLQGSHSWNANFVSLLVVI